MRLLASLGGSHIYNYIQFEGEGGWGTGDVS